MLYFYSFLISQISLVNKKILMTIFNGNYSIELLSHLIELILYCQLNSDTYLYKKISAVIAQLEVLNPEDRFNLKVGIQIISKLRYPSQFQVKSTLQEHLKANGIDKYSLYLHIFQFYNNKQQQQICSEKIIKTRTIDMWVFKKQDVKKINNQQFALQYQSDLIVSVLSELCAKKIQKRQVNNNNQEVIKNNTPSKGYQLIIKTKCSKTLKNKLQVLQRYSHKKAINQQENIFKSFDLDSYKYWQKSVKIFNESQQFSVGCYSIRIQENKRNQQMETEIRESLHNDRKFSAETKAQQKSKNSQSSLKVSFQNFSSRFSSNNHWGRPFKEKDSYKKLFQLPKRKQRPRYHSIYESKDQQLNVFILSPRKLSDQQSPKISSFQQKTISFQINDHRHQEISEQLLQQFTLQPDEQASNPSSEQFQMLQENDYIDSIKQDKRQQICEEVKGCDNRLQTSSNKIVLERLNVLESKMVKLLKRVDQVIIF